MKTHRQLGFLGLIAIVVVLTLAAADQPMPSEAVAEAKEVLLKRGNFLGITRNTIV